MPIVNLKAQNLFSTKISHKGLLLKLKQKLNLPAYVIDRLIVNYEKEADSIDQIENLIKENTINAKNRIKLQEKIREQGELTFIDRVSLKNKQGKYLARLLNLGLKNVAFPDGIVKDYPELLERGLWSEIKLVYQGKDEFEIVQFSPYIDCDFNLEEYQNKAEKFTFFQWSTLLLRSMGFASEDWPLRKKLLMISRLIPLVEKNYNFIELGSRNTGKSYVYRQLFPQSILVSGGKTTVANLFYDMRSKKVGLVGNWDLIAFDEVAYIDFKDKTTVQILKDYMESGSFSRGSEEVFAEASMVFLGNINQDLEILLHKDHLFEPLPELMKDLALIDRFHFYLPGWEMDKLNEEDLTNDYGFRSDYLALALHNLRELDFSSTVDQHFKFISEMDIRDKRAVKKTVSGFLKLLHPTGNFNSQDIKTYLDLALEGRKRVKDQLVKIGSFEYENTNFAYSEIDSEEEYFPVLPESQLDFGFRRRLPESGTVYIGQIIDEEKFGLLKLTIESEPGSGNLIFRNEVNHNLRQNIRKVFIYLRDQKSHSKINADAIEENDFYIKINLLSHEITADISNAFIVALYSLINDKAVSNGLLVTEKSSLYRKPHSKYGLKALKVEEDGRVRTLIPLKKNNIFVEVPNEIISYAPYFIVV